MKSCRGIFWLRQVQAVAVTITSIVCFLSCNDKPFGRLKQAAVMYHLAPATHHAAVWFLWLQGLWLASAECVSDQDSGGVRPLPLQEHTLLLHRQQQEGLLLR
jgi:hypothetical protein